jgi:hypothetical protein
MPNAGTTAKHTATTLATVAVPALGGQLASAAGKALLPGSIGKMPNMLADAVGGGVVGALTLGVVFALGGKGAAMRAIPFVAAGAALGVGLPYVDDVIDAMVAGILGAPTVAAAASAAAVTAPGGVRRIPGGVPRTQALGGTIPGGVPRTQALGGTIPGGRRGTSSVAQFRRTTTPGGVMP